MIRKIDKYNRVGIPKEMQKLLGIKTGQAVDINYDGNKIIIYPMVKETIRSYIISEQKRYKQFLIEKQDEISQIVYNAVLIELDRLLAKYDELY